MSGRRTNSWPSCEFIILRDWNIIFCCVLSESTVSVLLVLRSVPPPSDSILLVDDENLVPLV